MRICLFAFQQLPRLGKKVWFEVDCNHYYQNIMLNYLYNDHLIASKHIFNIFVQFEEKKIFTCFSKWTYAEYQAFLAL